MTENKEVKSAGKSESINYNDKIEYHQNKLNKYSKQKTGSKENKHLINLKYDYHKLKLERYEKKQNRREQKHRTERIKKQTAYIQHVNKKLLNYNKQLKKNDNMVDKARVLYKIDSYLGLSKGVY